MTTVDTGLWAGFLDRLPTTEAVEHALAIEAAGVGTIWLQEHSGVDPFVRAALYLGATNHLRVALGVAVVHARDPEAMVAAAATLEEAFAGRFVLGLGVSHRALVEARGHEHRPPIATMTDYLAAMDRAVGRRRLPLRVLGALGPRMVALAGAATGGVHTYFSPVAHTAAVRETIGTDGWLAPSQMVAVTTGDSDWRAAVRPYLQLCLGMPNYTSNLRRFGFDDDDFETTSERLVDALVVPDEPSAVESRVEAQRIAGADHVVLQLVPPPPAGEVLRRLPALIKSTSSSIVYTAPRAGADPVHAGGIGHDHAG